MAVQIVRNQLIDLVINADKLDTGAVSYGKIASADIETSLTGGANKLASASAIKAYVDGQLPDTFSGGNGIDIDTSGDPDVISVDLATDPGLQFTSNKLDLKIAEASLVKDNAGVKVKLKAETGGTISVDANGIYLADGAVANAKLANSTISGKALGANLDNLSAGNGLTGTDYNGSGAQSFAVQPDGASIAVGASGISVADGGVTAAKVAFATQLDSLTTDGSATAFDLSETIADNFAVIMVHRNGLMLEQVQGTPSGVDQFKLELTAGAGGVSRVTFGAAPASTDSVTVFYIA